MNMVHSNPKPVFTSSQGSDYGGDFSHEEEEALSVLLTQYNSQRPASGEVGHDGAPQVVESGSECLYSPPRMFASPPVLEDLVENDTFPAEIKIALPTEQSSSQAVRLSQKSLPAKPFAESAGTDGQPEISSNAGEAQGAQSKVPLTRFRSRKPLSVTDLVSPAWCELQYSFSLHRHGKKRRTAAMRQGSVAHQKLEDEVHTTFSVEVMTKEDAWGLRFWNVIQGARTLRETGMTRELETWGLIDGQLVNGVIDELSYECPDFDLELKGQALDDSQQQESGQQSIEDFFGSQRGNASRSSRSAPGEQPKDAMPRVYLKDHKTRTARSVPKDSAFRPTRMQLMIYYKLLADLVSESSSFDPSVIWERYDIDPDAPFSNGFIHQFGDTPLASQGTKQGSQEDHESLLDNASVTAIPQASEHSSHSVHTQVTEPSILALSFDDLNAVLRAYPTSRELWSRMIAELRRAMPAGLGDVLSVDYWDQSDAEHIGSKAFLFDNKAIEDYSKKTMEWWKGQREPVGVEVNDAWKCRICEFAETCQWRKDKIEEGIQGYRARTKKW